MKNSIIVIILIFSLSLFVSSCKTTRQINKVISPKDTTQIQVNKSVEDSIRMAHETLDALNKQIIDFKTFSAKVRVEVEGTKGKQPDITAIIKIIKDSAIWMSLSATFLNFEVYRVLITRNDVILLNKQDKEVQYRSIDYLQEVTEIAFDYKTLENLLIGNPIFYNDSMVSIKRMEGFILLSSLTEEFKNLLTLSSDTKVLVHSKLDDVDVFRNRTADLTYGDYENKNGMNFSTYRQIIATEKNKIDIRLNFKQYEFNKELSVAFNVPKNYKRK